MLSLKRPTTIGLLVLLGGMYHPCRAGTVYKCIQADGTSSYGHVRRPHGSCSVFDHYADTRAITRSAPAIAATARVDRDQTTTAPVPSPAVVAKPRRRLPQTRSVGHLYAYIQDGVRHYTSQRPQSLPTIVDLRTIHYDVIETCFACGKATSINFNTLPLNTMAYQSEIARAATQSGVEEAFIRAIIHAESAYNPRALSRAGAQGLMQLMPATAQRFGVSNGFDAAANIQAGSRYLAWLLGHFYGDLTLVAAGYNAGEAAVEHYHGIPPYDETQRYVERVAILLGRYRQARSLKPGP